MFATFLCKNCKAKIIIDFSNPNNIPNSCSKCGSKFSNIHYITSFADTFFNLQRALFNLEFYGLTSGKTNVVYNSDIESLEELFLHSSPKVKDLLSQIIDINFLIIHQAAKNEDLKELEEYISNLRALFEKKVKLKNEKAERLLGLKKD